MTFSLPRKRSTPELRRHSRICILKNRAEDRVRTGDIQLGRLTLYQLSYFRLFCFNMSNAKPDVIRLGCGESRIRTCEGKTNRFTVCPRWPLEYLPKSLNSEPKIKSITQFKIFSSIFLKNAIKHSAFLSRWRDSNPRPADYKSAALAS